MLFNTLFTSLPVIFMGIFDKDLNASTLIAIPELYTIGQRNAGFNIKVYLGWMLMATAECTLIFYIALTLYGRAPFTPDNTIFPLGIITYSAVVCLVSIKMQYVPPISSAHLIHSSPLTHSVTDSSKPTKKPT
jgi:phospholipid-translocating ATPase